MVKISGKLETQVRETAELAVIKTVSKKKKCKKAKWLSQEALQIAEKREAKSKGKRTNKPI